MINNHRTSSSKMEDIRQILLQNPELPHEENLHYLYQLEFLKNNLTPSSKMEDNHFQNLDWNQRNFIIFVKKLIDRL